MIYGTKIALFYAKRGDHSLQNICSLYNVLKTTPHHSLQTIMLSTHL